VGCVLDAPARSISINVKRRWNASPMAKRWLMWLGPMASIQLQLAGSTALSCREAWPHKAEPIGGSIAPVAALVAVEAAVVAAA
jgi:hypothetical protein